jgi:hypothetical protein
MSADNSLDRYKLSPQKEEFKLEDTSLEEAPKTKCSKRLPPPAPHNSESKYPIAILNIGLHGTIMPNISSSLEVSFDEVLLDEYIPDTKVFYRSNTLSGCYNYSRRFYTPRQLKEWYTLYVETYKDYLLDETYVDEFDEEFAEILRSETNKRLKNEFKRRITLDREILSIISETEDKEYIKSKKDESRLLTNMFKQLKEHEGVKPYIHPTHILNKYYTAVSSVKNIYDTSNPESYLILTYVYETQEGTVNILHFDLLQDGYNEKIYRYQNNCIYGLLDFLEFVIPDTLQDVVMDFENPDNHSHPLIMKMKPLLEFVQHLFNVQANKKYRENTEENIAKKREHASIDTREVLSFLSAFYFKKLYIYDNSCSDYAHLGDMSMIKRVDEKIHTLPENIARGKTKKKKRTKSSDKRSRHRRKQRRRLG